MKHEDLTSIIISICIKIHKDLGPGLLESVYEEILCYELIKQGIPFTRQQGIPIVYEDVKLELGFRSDVVVDNKVLVELKSVESVPPVYAKKVLTYLRFTGVEVGLLINFHVALLKDGITRLMLDRRN